MARLKRLVYDSVVVNLAEDEALLGNEFPLLAMTDLLDGGGFDLKTGVSKVRRRVAVDGILKEVFLNGIAEGPTTTVGLASSGASVTSRNVLPTSLWEYSTIDLTSVGS